MFTQKPIFKHGLTLIFLFVVCGVTVTTGIPVAYAQAAPANPSQMWQLVQETLSIVNTFAHVFILIVLNLLQYLLQADFFNDGKMMGALNKIWQLSRNITNVLFAVMLIGVAFYTIIAANGELIKTKWNQFVLAVILVNFSWFFPRIIIDVANVVTATVYSIPDMLPSITCVKFPVAPATVGKPCQVITDVLLMPANPFAISTWETNSGCPASGTTSSAGVSCPCDPSGAIGCYKLENYDTFKLTAGPAHAMINGMAVSFINIDVLTKVPPGLAGPPIPAGGGMAAFKTTFGIMMNIMMTLFVQIATILPLMGLCIGLFVRILILWVTIAFMPFTFIGLVINGKLGTNIFGFEQDVWMEFINAAFLPAVVAIPFVIGFIMLTTVASIPAPPGSYQQTWGVPLLSGVGSWWPFLWMLAAVAIIYIGAFAALARSKVTGKLTEKLKGFGDMLAGAAIQLPLIVPLPIGIPGKPNANLGTLFNGPKHLAQQIRLKAEGLEPGGGIPAPGATPNTVNPHNLDDATHTAQIVAAIDKLTTSTTDAQRNVAFREITTKAGGENLSRKELLEAMQREIVNKGGSHKLDSQLPKIQAELARENRLATDKTK